MTSTVKDVMTREPRTVEVGASIAEAARIMRDDDLGAVVVVQGGKVGGLLTDRDIVVRAVADHRDLESTSVCEIASTEVTGLSPEATIDQAAQVMRERAVRRLPVIEDGRAVGIVSLGDLAIDRDRTSVLGSISAAPSNT